MIISFQISYHLYDYLYLAIANGYPLFSLWRSVELKIFIIMKCCCKRWGSKCGEL